jgi:hypothetical protein
MDNTCRITTAGVARSCSSSLDELCGVGVGFPQELSGRLGVTLNSYPPRLACRLSTKPSKPKSELCADFAPAVQAKSDIIRRVKTFDNLQESFGVWKCLVDRKTRIGRNLPRAAAARGGRMGASLSVPRLQDRRVSSTLLFCALIRCGRLLVDAAGPATAHRQLILRS